MARTATITKLLALKDRPLASVVHPSYGKLPVALLNVSIFLSHIYLQISKKLASRTFIYWCITFSILFLSERHNFNSPSPSSLYKLGSCNFFLKRRLATTWLPSSHIFVFNFARN